MTIHTVVPEKDATREALSIAQSNFKRATTRHEKIASTIEQAEDRLARAQVSLAKYGEHLDQEVADTSARLILQNRELKIPENLARRLADAGQLKTTVKILTDGLGALREQLKEAYSAKRESFTELDEAACAVIRDRAEPLEMRLAELRNEERILVTRLRDFQNASIIREKSEFYVAAHTFVGQLGEQLLRASMEPLPIDRVNTEDRTRAVSKWHASLLKDDAATLSEKIDV
jgi:chaperonin cofactor prefoldin